MAETNVKEFTLDLARYARLLDVSVAKFTKAVALQAASEVVPGTRVDTGRARGNWQVQEGGAPPEQTVAVTDSNFYDPSGSGEIENGVARDARSEVQTEVLEMTGEDIIWLHNGLPYINVLEDLDRMVAGTVEALRIQLASKSLESWIGKSPTATRTGS